jgi:LuxR family transcriptional regulator, maltose regulon positive regulatory protein
MSHKTPWVVDGSLKDGSVLVPLDTPDWYAWLEEHNTFHFEHPSGGFTARKERKQRGKAYWVAYRQVHKKLYKTYIGKSETLTHSHLCEVSEALNQLAQRP